MSREARAKHALKALSGHYERTKSETAERVRQARDALRARGEEVTPQSIQEETHRQRPDLPGVHPSTLTRNEKAAELMGTADKLELPDEDLTYINLNNLKPRSPRSTALALARLKKRKVKTLAPRVLALEEEVIQLRLENTNHRRTIYELRKEIKKLREVGTNEVK